MKTINIQALHILALTGLITLALMSTSTASDFSGNLKGVTMTDAQATNMPPSVAFTYSISGNTVTFDATGSTDPDGSISLYKWDFGDGTIGDGVVTSHTYSDLDKNYSVVLTSVDDKGGVGIIRNMILLHSYKFYSTLDSLDDLANPIAGVGGTGTADLTFSSGYIGNAITKSSSTTSGFTIPSTNVSTSSFTIEFVFIPSHASADAVFNSWNTVLGVAVGTYDGFSFKGTNGGGSNWAWQFTMWADDLKSYTISSGFLSSLKFSAGDYITIKIEFDKTSGVGNLYINEISVGSFNNGSPIVMDQNWGRSSASSITFFKNGTHTSKIDELKIQ